MKIAPAFLDTVYRDGTYEGLVWLSSMIHPSGEFERSNPTYNLPEPLFVIVEGLTWFAQGVRSGSRTYFEATPADRQQAMLIALRRHAPLDFADQYDRGMRSWHLPGGLTRLDQWIDRNDGRNTTTLWRLAQTYRADIESYLV